MALLLLAQSTNFCKEAWMNIRMFSMWPDGSFKTWGTWGSAKKIWGTFHVDAPYQVQMMWVSQGSLVAAFGPSRNQSLGAPGSQGLSRWLQRCCTDWLVMIRKNSCQLDVYSCVYIYIYPFCIFICMYIHAALYYIILYPAMIKSCQFHICQTSSTIFGQGKVQGCRVKTSESSDSESLGSPL